VAVTTYLFFLYESKSSGEFKQLRARLGDRLTASLLKSALMAVGSQLVVFLSYVAGFFPSVFFLQPGAGKTPPRPDRPAVILVHGLYHNCSAWLLMKWRLRRAGVRNVYAFNYLSFNAEFFEIRRSLEKYAEDVATIHGPGKVFFIGHSMGGLLCRSLLSTPGGRKCAAGVVTLGAPHHGSKLAAVGQLGRCLEHEGALIKAIESEEKRPECPCLNIYSPLDNFVLPTAAQRIRTPGWHEVATADISHLDLLFHPAPAALAIDFLRAQRADG
jgi:pimeloyl-ACP methyl ester carboxylesterase